VRRVKGENIKAAIRGLRCQTSRMARCPSLSTRSNATKKPPDSVTLPGGSGILQSSLPVPIPSLTLQNRLKSVALFTLYPGISQVKARVKKKQE
jgi:hypothetical protein